LLCFSFSAGGINEFSGKTGPWQKYSSFSCL